MTYIPDWSETTAEVLDQRYTHERECECCGRTLDVDKFEKDHFVCKECSE